MATRHALAELARDYESQFGRSIELVSIGGVDAVRRVRSGESFDFAVLAAAAIDALAASGHVDAAGRVDVAQSEVALAVMAGAPRPDVTSERSIRASVETARTIGCSTGPSGAHVVRLLERWGLRDAAAPRIVQAPPGVPVATLVARGEADMGFQQLSELMDAPGIDVVGVLPPEIQDITIFAGAICVSARDREEARGFLRFLASPRAEKSKRRHGLAPAT